MSTPNAKYGIIDIKDVYLNSKLEDFELVRMPYDIVPQDITNLCNLDEIVNDDGVFYIEVQGGMCGYPIRQASSR